MGTRFSAAFFAGSDVDLTAVGEALSAAVTEVDDQMSTWKPSSDLMRFNRAPVGDWVELPEHLLTVLAAGLEIGRASGGAFDVGVLDHVHAWGFGAEGGVPAPEEIAQLAGRRHLPAHEIVVVDREVGRAMKRQPCSMDLSGIAKGYGVDRLAETLTGFGIGHFLVSIDGELRAAGGKPDGSPWRVAVEQPDPTRREIAGVVDLIDGAIATSGNYRHRRELDGHSYSHTIDPRTGRPITDDIYSATVCARTCMEADAWATVVMVLGEALVSPMLASRSLNVMTIGPEHSSS
jgi:thiamine biosynthesis lipoprotein